MLQYPHFIVIDDIVNKCFDSIHTKANENQNTL